MGFDVHFYTEEIYTRVFFNRIFKKRSFSAFFVGENENKITNISVLYRKFPQQARVMLKQCKCVMKTFY